MNGVSAATSCNLNRRLADPIEIFRAVCVTCEYRYAVCEVTLHDAVDALQAAALKLNLIDAMGQDAVQATVASAFASISEADERFEEASAEIANREVRVREDEEYCGLCRSFAQLCQEADVQIDQRRRNQRARDFHADIPLVARDGAASENALQRAYESSLARHAPPENWSQLFEVLLRDEFVDVQRQAIADRSSPDA
jgi:hypothetical protein